jgi:hypothetical protein
VKSILFWITVGIVALLGLRHLFSIMSGWSQDGKLKQGQRLCHATSLLILMSSCVIAVILRAWWPLVVGVVSEHLYRLFTIWTGKRFSLCEEENE